MSAERETSRARRLTDRLEQLLSDPHATSLEVVDGLFQGEALDARLPAEKLHRMLVRTLSEAVQDDGRDWLLQAVERFLAQLANASS